MESFLSLVINLHDTFVS